MALGPISNLGVPAPQPAQGRDVTNAQRAFFQTALGQATPVAQVAPAEPPKAQATATQSAEPARPAAQTETPRTTYRPGSLLDIRI
jgi:hypothetical protein